MCGDVRESWFERCDEAKMDDGRRGGGSEVNDDIYIYYARGGIVGGNCGRVYGSDLHKWR